MSFFEEFLFVFDVGDAFDRDGGVESIVRQSVFKKVAEDEIGDEGIG